MIDYLITPEVGPNGATALRVQMHFAGNADGETRITLPQTIADQEELWRGVEDVRAEGATVTAPLEPHTRVLRHRANAPVTLSYRVVQSFDGQLSFDRPLLRPIFQPAWFAVEGEALFARVVGREGALTRFRWGRIPTGWTAVSNAQYTSGTRGTSFDDLRESVLIGGRDVRMTQSQAAGARLRVVSLGAPGFDVPQFVRVLQRAAEVAARMWDYRGRDYLVAVIPIPAPPDVAGQLGWSRHNGFALYVTPKVDESDLVHVITHEYMHSWFPTAFGRVAPEATGTEAWFSEGFTDYYADRALLVSGVWSLEDFAAHYQTVVRDYWSSPARTAKGAQLAAGFFRDHDLERMSYLRGALMAASFDRRIRLATNGHETLHSALLAAMKIRDGASPVTHLQGVALRMGVDLGPDLAALAAGADLDFPPNIFGDCVALRTVQTASYERGFPAVALGQPVRDVDPGGPAYEAGLRNGMIMVQREAGEPGDSRVEQVWRVRVGDAERRIHFFPRGRAMATMRDVFVMPNLNTLQRANCVRDIVYAG